MATGDLVREIKLQTLEELLERIAELEAKIVALTAQLAVVEDAVTAPPFVGRGEVTP